MLHTANLEIMRDRQLRIGELAERAGVSTRSLRHYEQEGLLSPSRAENGYRIYDGTDLVRVENIKGLLDVGLTISDIRGYVDAGCLDRPYDHRDTADADGITGTTCDVDHDIVGNRLQRLDELIERLTTTREQLADYSTKLRRPRPTSED